MGAHLFEELPEVMEKFAAQIPLMVSQCVQRAVLAGGDYLATSTPVDTGVARSNWVMSIDSIFSGVVPAYAPYPTYNPEHTQVGFTQGRYNAKKGTYGKSTPTFSRKDEGANLTAVRVQHSIVASQFDAMKHEYVSVSNNIPYIESLNDGASKQADAGFFEKSPLIAMRAITGAWVLKDIP